MTQDAAGAAAGAGRELVADGWSFPTSLAFDDAGVAYVAESGLPFGGAPAGGRVWRLDPEGRSRLLADGLGAPVNGLVCHDGWLYVSEGGQPGRISRLGLDGSLQVLVDGLPGGGDYQTNMVAVGRDRRLYFSQGAMTNSGIVGLDALELGWLRRLLHAHDLSGHDLVLTGVNVQTPDPRANDPQATTVIGAFVPFGTPTRPGQRIPATLPCTAAVLCCDLDGGRLELVAWGCATPTGWASCLMGGCWRSTKGADDRGSRPIGNAPEALYEIQAGGWYGWPDFVAGRPVTDPAFQPDRGAASGFLLANHDQLPPPTRPLLVFPPHAAAVKFAVVPAGPWAGQLLVALFGDEVPLTAPAGPRVGRSLVRVDPPAGGCIPWPSGRWPAPSTSASAPTTGSCTCWISATSNSTGAWGWWPSWAAAHSGGCPGRPWRRPPCQFTRRNRHDRDR